MTLTTIATYSIGGGSSSSPHSSNHPYDLVLAHGSVIDFNYPPNPSSSAIVNAANERCVGGGGIDGAINNAGGQTLIADRRALPTITTQRGGGGGNVRCPTGNAVITGPNTYGRLHVKYVIHAVGPNYTARYSNMNDNDYNDYDDNGTQESDDLLHSAYISALDCAKEANLEAIAFSLLSAGIYRGDLPLSVVLRIGMDAICNFQGYPGLMTVFVCAYTQDEIDTLLEISEGMGLSPKPVVLPTMEDDEHKKRVDTTNTMPPPSNADEKLAVAEEWEVRRDELKVLGDTHFRSKSYAAAIQAYQDALDLDPTNYILLSNKSAAHLANGEKSKSLYDARKCVVHAPNWGKGHTRLAAAMASLGRYNEAVAVYTKVLNELDPTNDMAKRGLEECRAKQQTVREEKEREASELQRELDRQKAEQARQENNDINTTTEVGDEADELLDDFFSEVDKVATKPPPSSKNTDGECDDDSKTNRIKDQLNDLGTSEYQINRILQTNYEWKNLNPFHVLDISYTIEDESIISLRYRALSLLVHPDKCPENPVRAKDAFEQVHKAMTQMNDTDKRRHIKSLIEQGMKQGRRDWEAERSKGSVESDGLAKAQNKATMKIMAEIEHARRDIDRRRREFEQRERSQEDEEKTKEKNEREHDKRWREGERVDKRVDNWRDFAGGGGDKTGKKGRLV